MRSDVEYFLESLCIQSSNSRNFTLRILDKAAYIFNIFLQFIVLPQFSVSMSAVIKENTKKQIWSLFTRTRNIRTIKAEGLRRRSGFDKGRHVCFFVMIFKGKKKKALRGSHTKVSHQDSRGYWHNDDTTKKHNLYLKKLNKTKRMKNNKFRTRQLYMKSSS